MSEYTYTYYFGTVPTSALQAGLFEKYLVEYLSPHHRNCRILRRDGRVFLVERRFGPDRAFGDDPLSAAPDTFYVDVTDSAGAARRLLSLPTLAPSATLPDAAVPALVAAVLPHVGVLVGPDILPEYRLRSALSRYLSTWAHVDGWPTEEIRAVHGAWVSVMNGRPLADTYPV